jgi:hypothetical protein
MNIDVNCNSPRKIRTIERMIDMSMKRSLLGSAVTGSRRPPIKGILVKLVLLPPASRMGISSDIESPSVNAKRREDIMKTIKIIGSRLIISIVVCRKIIIFIFGLNSKLKECRAQYRK